MARSSRASGGVDPWRDIENAALNAFKGTANLKAPGLVAVLRRCVRYARVDHDNHQIVVERKAFLLGLCAVGTLDKPSQSFGNTATWAAAFIAEHGGANVAQLIQSQLTGTDEVVTAFQQAYSVVASPEMLSVADRAKVIASMTINRRTGDLRHFLTAFLEDVNGSLRDFSQAGWRTGPADLSLLKRTLFDRIDANPESNENMDAWDDLLLQDVGVVEKPAGEVAGFTSDRAGVAFTITDRDLLSNDGDDPIRDPLMLMADVRAFARLVCLEEAEPPLSIGVFGGGAQANRRSCSSCKRPCPSSPKRKRCKRSMAARQANSRKALASFRTSSRCALTRGILQMLIYGQA